MEDKPAGGESRLWLRFWGVRGSIPTPGPSTVRYGGETTCIEVHAGPHVVVIDCGSGARELGPELMRTGVTDFDLLFTHTHLDHVCGLPFFCSAYDPATSLHLWAGHVPPHGSLEEIIGRLMSPPIFPVPTTALRNTSFNRFQAGEDIEIRPGLVLRTVPLHHPGEATGYRIDWHGSSVCIITDHEHGDTVKDEGVAQFVQNADVMIYDSTYTEAEYPRYRGWGHSTPAKAIELARGARVGRVVLFHHDPRRTDEALDAIGREAAACLPGTIVARQGMTIAIDRGIVTMPNSERAAVAS